MSTWLSKLVEAHSESESPSKFFYWSGLATLSATIRNNIYLDRHTYTLYPNVYIFLIAASGMKKGVPINVAKSLLNLVDCTRVISGRNSIQQVINDLSKPYKPDNDNAVIKQAHGIMVAGELAAFLVKDPDALTILTDIHDSGYHEKEWKYSLRSAIVRLQSPCLTLLGATNEEHFDEAVPPNQVSGGFIARTFVIYSDKPGTLNSLTNRPNKLVNLKEFVPYLDHLSKIKGEMKWTLKGIECFDKFYYSHMSNISRDTTGTLRRLPDQILKAAMLISLSDGFSMTLEERFIDEAIAVCEDAARESKIITSNRGKGQLTHHIKIILTELVRKEDHTRDRNWMIKRFWQEGYSSVELDITIETLSTALTINGTAKNPSYTLKEVVVNEYKFQEADIKRKLV